VIPDENRLFPLYQLHALTFQFFNLFLDFLRNFIANFIVIYIMENDQKKKHFK